MRNSNLASLHRVNMGEGERGKLQDITYIGMESRVNSTPPCTDEADSAASAPKTINTYRELGNPSIT
jgi:hypothetical protein